MIDYKKLEIHRQALKAQHEAGLVEMTERLQNEDVLELVCFLAFMHHISARDGKSPIEPSVLEYVTCMGLKRWNERSAGRKDVENFLRIWQLGERLIRGWMEWSYYEGLSESDTAEETERKLFSTSLKISYGMTRGYSWYRPIEKKNLDGIFGKIGPQVEKIIGFYPWEAWDVIEAYEKILASRMEALRNGGGDLIDGQTEPVEVYRSLYQWNYQTLFGVTADELLSACPNVSEPHLRGFLALFSMDLCWLPEYGYETILDSSPYDSRPIIQYKDRFFIPKTQEVLWKLRERIEDEIKQTKFWPVYDKKHKAEYLEQESIALFKRLLPQCKIYHSLFYYPEGCPSGCELDAIALYDNIVILIESKSGIYSRSAKRGGLDRLRKNVKENIEKAFEQGNRTKEYIKNSETAVFYEKNSRSKEALRIRGADYKYFFVINTTLDYYAELGVDLYRLQELGIYREKEFPWTVCLSDLEVIADFIDFPNQFIYYMMMRTQLNQSLTRQNGIKMVYELDLFAMYKLENTELFDQYRLDAADEHALLDCFEEETGEQAEQELWLCTSFDFSAYFFEFYERHYADGKVTGVPPKLYNQKFLEMCRQLEEYQVHGYSDFIFRLLDMDLEWQNRVMDAIEQICSKSRADRKIHEITIKKMQTQFLPTEFGLVAYSGYTKDRKKIERLARVAGTIQQGLTGIRDWIVLCVYLDDDRHFVNQFFYHFGNEESQRVGECAAKHIPVQKGEKIGRNQPCPCGSGKKYKFCCGR